MKHLPSLIPGILKAVFILSLALGTQGCKKSSGTDPPAPSPKVSVQTVTHEDILLTTELPGRTTACRTAQIRPQVSGLIQHRFFEEGASVKAGQPLYQIDPAPFQAALENARAGLTAAQRASDMARAGLKAALADQKRLSANLDLAQVNEDRYETLFEKHCISAIQRDQAVTTARAARAALDAAMARVQVCRDEMAGAEAAIEQTRALVDTAEINLSYTQILAPISGRIGRSAVTEGAIVTAYQPAPLALIQQLDPIFVDVPQSTAELLRLRKRLHNGELDSGGRDKNRVRLLLEDGSEYPLDGTLAFREINVDPTTGSVILRAEFPNPDHLLLPCMFVRAVVREGVSPDAILIPQEAVARDGRGNPMTFLVTGESRVRAQPLILERAIQDQWLVSSGLKQGDRFIVQGIQKVRAGARVTPVDAAATPLTPPAPGGK